MTMDSRWSGDMPVVGAKVMTADGKELGTVKEISGRCFKVDAPMQPDYWLASDCIRGSSGSGVQLTFNKDRLGDAKMSGPDKGRDMTDADAIDSMEHAGVHRHTGD